VAPTTTSPMRCMTVHDGACWLCGEPGRGNLGGVPAAWAPGRWPNRRYEQKPVFWQKTGFCVARTDARAGAVSAIDPIQHFSPIHGVGEVRATAQRVQAERRDPHDDVGVWTAEEYRPHRVAGTGPPRSSPFPASVGCSRHCSRCRGSPGSTGPSTARGTRGWNSRVILGAVAEAVAA